MCMTSKKMCHKIIAICVIVVALTLAIAISFWPQKHLDIIADVTRFFDVMIPALAVGALLKYLICDGCGCSKNKGKGKEKDSCCGQ